MLNPHIFREKLETAYCWFANAVAAEDPGTTDHVKRLKVARMMITEPVVFDKFIVLDMTAQNFNSDTSQEDINNRLSALGTNLVALGFGD
jgi:hypothetical protein